MTTELEAAVEEVLEARVEGIIRDALSEGHSRQFRWDGTVNLGHMLTMTGVIISTVGGMLWTYSTFDKRLTRVEDQLIRQTEVIDRSIRTDEQLRAVRDRLDKLERVR